MMMQTLLFKGLLNKSETFSVLNKSDRRRHRSPFLFLHFAKGDDLRFTERPKPFQHNGSF